MKRENDTRLELCSHNSGTLPSSSPVRICDTVIIEIFHGSNAFEKGRG
jgi:hypothetical protein